MQNHWKIYEVWNWDSNWKKIGELIFQEGNKIPELKESLNRWKWFYMWASGNPYPVAKKLLELKESLNRWESFSICWGLAVYILLLDGHEQPLGYVLLLDGCEQFVWHIAGKPETTGREPWIAYVERGAERVS